ncbi:PstS family phosphate ABC transporter substrate-binding protein [Salinispora arenicola]|uniref:Phosphate-binding protein n=1 Tax=Salinispora arenicola (strain CNS-205) TaxID=391037 RepID=A8LYP9_SALAI|nr:PstS family phosphate ABC transporter substrate-binding protein [Salinispora arenicola]MCN0178033.1 PstS family phosphate ABC transporter substrate-binding protein [Salinispora arenicola]NIL56052.1 PstS family phosphate ABC transporter substrate-binding protein [Salinispora arenicola]NIL60799.1 PstS family phosphate ABC transporter substrate-binding protein [Salinispora arenicola]
MNRNVLSRRVIAGAALAALALTGCSSNNDTASDGDKLSGEVKVNGSSTVAPLSEAAATFYKETQSDVNVSVGTSGTGGGFERFCKGETDISDASRPIKDSEKEACAAAGIEYKELVVANDALTVVVSKDNDWADCLTVDQLKTIWEPDSKVTNWKQIDPTFPDEPLKLFGPGTDSGTFDYFTDEINGEEGASRTDYTASENDNVVVQGVAGTKGGLGYFGFTYFEENADKLKALKVDGGSGCVEPSLKTAQENTYQPLSRPLFIYVSDAGVKKEQVADFVTFYIERIDDIVLEAQYVPLTEEQKSTLKTEFDALKAAA